MLSRSRFNPASGLADFWNEFRKPNPYRWPILAASLVPAVLIFGWALSQTHYRDPERPKVTYITTFAEDRTIDEIIASNMENQQLKELRAAQEAEIAQTKREMYKALGAAAGMDVAAIEAKAEARRAAEEAAAEKKRAELLGRIAKVPDNAPATSESAAP
ncbi:MAG: hypothetical protein MUF47_01485 [Porphyrobacter sp.]|jgi:Spy/CpxP family protein refolding chaperone|nr:hypothetical protein [Porphyrobacter sp.]